MLGNIADVKVVWGIPPIFVKVTKRDGGCVVRTALRWWLGVVLTSQAGAIAKS